MSNFKLKPTHAPIKAYYETLEQFGRGKFDNEGNVRKAFESLPDKCARPFDWLVVPEYQIFRTGKNPLRVDAAMLDAFNLPRTTGKQRTRRTTSRRRRTRSSRLDTRVRNIFSQSPTRAILVQDGSIAYDGEITEPRKSLSTSCGSFLNGGSPHRGGLGTVWCADFSGKPTGIAKGAMTLIAGERKSNPAFVQRFTAFAELCRSQSTQT